MSQIEFKIYFKGAVMQSSNFEQINPENNNTVENVVERMRNTVSSCLEVCWACADTEAGRKLMVYALVGTVIVGSGLIFGTAFETASDVVVWNKSDQAVYPTWAEPFGVKNKCSVLLPNTFCSFKFNGINSYMDIDTLSSGTLHVNTKCQTALKDAPDNKKFTSKGITFWTCYTHYEDKANTAATSPEYVDFNNRSTTYLRGPLLEQPGNNSLSV
jgi:hypothetical protein